MKETAGSRARKRRPHRVTGILIFVVVMLLFAVLCWWLWQNQRDNRPTEVLGYELMTMHGDQMDPEISDGDLLLLVKAEPNRLVSGDVVIWERVNGQGGSIARIINILEKDGMSSVLVKSDRAVEAQTISLDAIDYCMASSIPFLGAVWDFLMTGLGMLCCIVAPCVLFFLVVLAHLILDMREDRRRPAEDPTALRQKLSSHKVDDQREHFVDVTADFTGQGHGKPYLSPLRQELAPNKQEESAFLTDKYDKLDFNPIAARPPENEGVLERVLIPDNPAAGASILRMTIDGEEAAQLPLSGAREVSIKIDGYRIDISVAPNR